MMMGKVMVKWWILFNILMNERTVVFVMLLRVKLEVDSDKAVLINGSDGCGSSDNDSPSDKCRYNDGNDGGRNNGNKDSDSGKQTKNLPSHLKVTLNTGLNQAAQLTGRFHESKSKPLQSPLRPLSCSHPRS